MRDREPASGTQVTAAHGMRQDIAGGAIAAIVMLAIEGSYGLIALAPLGTVFTPLAFACGILTAVLANAAMTLAGARGPLLSGSSAPLALLMPPLLVALLARPELVRADGSPDTPLLFALASLGVILAGVMQALSWLLRVGRVVRYVPYPVSAGFTWAVALLMAVAIAPVALGLAPGQAKLAQALPQARPLAVVVTLLTLAVALRPPSWTRRVPRFLTALAAGTLLHHGLQAAGFGSALGPVLGLLPAQAWATTPVESLRQWQSHAGLVRELLPLLLQFALAVALVSSLQSLMGSSVVDGLLRQRGDRERGLAIQGMANLVAGIGGGLPVAGALSRTKLSMDAGARGPYSRIAFTVTLALAVTVGAGTLQHLPLAVIAGLFLASAWGLVDAWARRATLTLLRALRHAQRPPPGLAADFAVMAAVAMASVLFTLAHGIAVGVLLALVAFVRTQSRSPVRATGFGDRRRSLKVRGGAASRLLAAHGRRIAVIELDGALFFGTADVVADAVERTAREAELIVVDFRHVRELDVSGARGLAHAADALHARGGRLMFASLDAGGRWGRLLREMDTRGLWSAADFLPDVDLALERAEDHLLSRLAAAPERGHTLSLSETQLAAGLDAQETALLGSLLVEREVAAGTTIFRRGEAGDALYVAVRGDVEIWLPASQGHRARRLVAFAPGVVFGEMAVLQRQPRSADAVAGHDALLLALSRAALDRLERDHPALLARLLLNLNLQLAQRVRALSDELQAAHTHTE
ncbi:SulP family inorganic anion transporter [Caldimonas sp. KR1-144]|uniref:SulP family inorganic anion transporter n=1 Tax=Caldimonas sp. KR1-144 TaxID=3400911 RepID=UPI003BFFC922